MEVEGNSDILNTRWLYKMAAAPCCWEGNHGPRPCLLSSPALPSLQLYHSGSSGRPPRTAIPGASRLTAAANPSVTSLRTATATKSWMPSCARLWTCTPRARASPTPGGCWECSRPPSFPWSKKPAKLVDGLRFGQWLTGRRKCNSDQGCDCEPARTKLRVLNSVLEHQLPAAHAAEILGGE